MLNPSLFLTIQITDDIVWAYKDENLSVRMAEEMARSKAKKNAKKLLNTS